MVSGAALIFNYNDIDYNVWLYAANSANVTSSVDIVEHPMVTGDKVMDHMYRNADSIRLSGIIGSNKLSASVNEKVYNLDKFQQLMEDVKDNGVVCKLVKFKGEESGKQSSPVFKYHENLVLESITWTENVNTLDYSFSFKEVMFSETKEYNVTVDDALIPHIGTLSEKNFTESVFDINKCMADVVEELRKNGVISNDFWNKFFNVKENKETWIQSLVEGGIWGALTGNVAVSAISTLFKYTSSKLFDAISYSTKYKIKKFDKWNDKEKKRFTDFLESIKSQIEELSSKIKVYQLTENVPQELVLTFNNEYYTFQFKNENSTGKKTLTVLDSKEGKVASVGDLSSSPKSVTALDKKSALISTSNDHYAFICYIGEDSNDEKAKFGNYAIVISTIEPAKIMDVIMEIIRINIMKK